MEERIDELIGAGFGRYRLVERIGRGPRATVYRAEDVASGRVVAIKVSDLRWARTRFSTCVSGQTAIAARLAHPHLVPILDFGAAQGRNYLVMPYIPRAIAPWTDADPWTIAEVVGLLTPLAGALDLPMRAASITVD